MILAKKAYTTFLLLLLFNAVVNSQSSLPRSVPETEGVSSEGIIKFLDAMAKSKHEMHSLMILRHGKVIAEGWWKPYSPDLKHTMYSVSKTFTSTAIGFAVSEKKLSVNDKVVSFFPDDLPDTIGAYLDELTVKDLLTMSVGQSPDPTGLASTGDKPWIKTFLSLPIKDKPGTKFLYNSLGTYMLSAIVQKKTGQKLIEYLRPRLFMPLGIQEMDWETDPAGINTGGWGLRVKTEDMAKLGQLYLQKGKWNGKEILPASWIEEATTFKIDQAPEMPKPKKDSSDWAQGYCYQIWRCRNNGFRADGAFGQYIIVMPDQDAVIAITSESPNMQDEINQVWEYLLPAFQKNKLSTNENTTILKQRLAALSLTPPAKSSSPIETTISGKTFIIESNDSKMQSVSFEFRNNSCYASFKTDAATHKIEFGAGIWKEGVTTKPGPSLTARAKGYFAGLPAPKIVAAYSWKDNNTLELLLRYIESPHTEKFLCRFDENRVSVEISNSFDNNPANKKPPLKGSY